MVYLCLVNCVGLLFRFVLVCCCLVLVLFVLVALRCLFWFVMRLGLISCVWILRCALRF